MGGPLEEHSSGGGDSDYGSTGRDSNMNNPDFTSAAPHVNSLLDILRTTREQLYGQWGGRKQKLDHCYQLKLFEQDADKVGGGFFFDKLRDACNAAGYMKKVGGYVKDSRPFAARACERAANELPERGAVPLEQNQWNLKKS